jgi:hypothetical protein
VIERSTVDDAFVRDDPGIGAAMERAAKLGVELFVIDAGWYPNTGVDGRPISTPVSVTWSSQWTPARWARRPDTI